MTNPTSRRRARDPFDGMIEPATTHPTPEVPVPASAVPRRGWALPVATVVMGVLGIGAFVAAVLSPGTLGPADAAAPAVSASPTPTSTLLSVNPNPTPAATGGSSALSVSERADPAWVARIAKAANIPERALAAYAGAALAIAETNPGCGLGWNTLATIGHVETEHGTMNGARIRDDGVAAPTITGVPLNGSGVAEIRDTDQGRVDGDTTWDRAVGPMQFIPDTWEQHAQDGNGDGTADINQIDDAALAAAVYLCTSGGDLTQPTNWIAAINAYNPSVEYNNRVAEAANHYATLR